MKFPVVAFHLSFNPKLPSKLEPRQPYGSEKSQKGHITHEDLPKRVSFSPTIRQCLIAVYPNYSHYFEDKKFDYPYMDFYVYGAIITKDTKIIKEKELSDKLRDYHITKEIAVLEPIHVDLVGKIRFFNTTNENSDIYYRPFNDHKREEVFLSPKPKFDVLEHTDKLYDISK